MGSTKRFLIFLLVAVSSPFIFFSILRLFPEEPATPEKMVEVLDQEFIKQQKKERLDTYIKLLDFFEAHKQEIIDSVSVKDNSACIVICLNDRYNFKCPKLPQHLLNECTPLIKSISPHSTYDGKVFLEIGNKSSLILKADSTDRENYLYIRCKFHLKDSKKNTDTLSYSGIVKEVVIRNKYYLRVEVADAFNHIDPNGLF